MRVTFNSKYEIPVIRYGPANKSVSYTWERPGKWISFGGRRRRLEVKKRTQIGFVLININTRNGEENGRLIRTCEIKLVVWISQEAITLTVKPSDIGEMRFLR